MPYRQRFEFKKFNLTIIPFAFDGSERTRFVYTGVGGGVELLFKRRMRTCPWMGWGAQFHDWSNFYGVSFSIELR